MNSSLPDELRARLSRWRADRTVIERFAPSHTRAQRFDVPPADARPAAVLSLLYPHDEQWHLPLIVRPSDAKHHQGQVALPGGACDAGESPDQTALRELEEELGLPAAQVELLGALTPFFVPASRFFVYPWVGWTSQAAFRPNPSEVADLIACPFQPITDLSALCIETRRLGGQDVEVPYFAVGPHKAWGATCIVLGELAAVCGGL
jgi:8-oxo-dGTP pyrophosphatase MutT (NUDIX family)